MTYAGRRALAACLLLAGIASGADKPQSAPMDAYGFNRLLGRGVNLGNALEAPREGEWGLTLKPEYFAEIANAGFNSVRIPIRWSAHAATEAPFDIEPAFFERVDWAIAQALSHKLTVIINVHHFDEMDKHPAANLPRLSALWRQIARHYRGQSDRLFFEILNEPHDQLNDDRWQTDFPQVLSAIRESNPHRIVIIGPSSWNNVDHLEKLTLPDRDRWLIATFHYYSPFEFTHQGAEWNPASAQWKGRQWTGSPAETAALDRDLQKAADWSSKHHRPIFLGEFGAYHVADMESRARWTRAVARGAEQRGMSWAYWEFGAGFGVYDRDANAWRKPLADALLGR